VTGVIKSLRKLVLGETWTIPAGVATALGASALARSALPHQLWSSGGGFVLAALVMATLLASLRSER
jgi:hypothetical protein